MQQKVSTTTPVKIHDPPTLTYHIVTNTDDRPRQTLTAVLKRAATFLAFLALGTTCCSVCISSVCTSRGSRNTVWRCFYHRDQFVDGVGSKTVDLIHHHHHRSLVTKHRLHLHGRYEPLPQSCGAAIVACIHLRHAETTMRSNNMCQRRFSQTWQRQQQVRA